MTFLNHNKIGLKHFADTCIRSGILLSQIQIDSQK